MKHTIFTVLILIFSISVYAQTERLKVVWNGYEADQKLPIDQMNAIFLDAFMECDKENKYLNIIPDYYTEGISSESYYKLNGNIKVEGNARKIITKLYFRESSERDIERGNSCVSTVSELDVKEEIKKHAQIKYVYLEDVINKERKISLPEVLTKFDKEYILNIFNMDNEKYDRAMNELNIIEQKYGVSSEITERRNKIGLASVYDNIIYIEHLIETAFIRELPDSVSEIYYEKAVNLLSEVNASLSQSENYYEERIQKLERLIKKYHESIEIKSIVYTSSLEISFDKPFKIMKEKDFDFNKAYPQLFGISLKYVFPFTSVYHIFVNAGYTGFNNNSKTRPVYINDISIQKFSLSLGYHAQFFSNKTISPYFYFGYGYCSLIEKATDSQNSVKTSFSSILVDYGIGSRVRISKNFALGCNICYSSAEWSSYIFSIGMAYIFFGKEEIFRIRRLE